MTDLNKVYRRREAPGQNQVVLPIFLRYNNKRYYLNMTIRTFKKIDKKGREEEWSWEETPEVLTKAAVLHNTIQQNKLKLEELSMTIKLLILKSGEDVIADIDEMVVNERVVGYYLDCPHRAKLVTEQNKKRRRRTDI